MTRSRRSHAFGVVANVTVLIGLAVPVACTGDDDADTASTDVGAVPGVTGPSTTSARGTPFCAGMIELAERLEDAEPETDDIAAMIRSAYADLADVVPDAIRADFEAVRRLLVDQVDVGGPAPTSPPTTTITVPDATAGPGDGEGTALADTPTERLADYVDLVCRSTANNPGPSATEPG
ncbi:MAG: hypothetical protein ACRDZZ_04070 [Ilumatobacteraceae bacterium]